MSTTIQKLLRRSISQGPTSHTRIFITSIRSKARHFSQAPAMARQEYLIQVPDFKNTTAQRLAAKKDHIVGATPLIESKQLSFFGVTFTEPSANDTANDTANATINGSVMVMEVESRDEVSKFLQNDAYTKAGVWDIQNARITPFRSG